jgi:hypothetical protein
MASFSPVKLNAAAIDVTVTSDRVVVVLMDGRTIAAPLAWSPRLADATPKQRKNWRLIGRGQGIHWPDVDEDIQWRACSRSLDLRRSKSRAQ